MEKEKKTRPNLTDLLELFDGTLVDTTALVDEMAGLQNCQRIFNVSSVCPNCWQGSTYSRRLAGVDVAMPPIVSSYARDETALTTPQSEDRRTR